jgi:hypothetical protein
VPNTQQASCACIARSHSHSRVILDTSAPQSWPHHTHHTAPHHTTPHHTTPRHPTPDGGWWVWRGRGREVHLHERRVVLPPALPAEGAQGDHLLRPGEQSFSRSVSQPACLPACLSVSQPLIQSRFLKSTSTHLFSTMIYFNTKLFSKRTSTRGGSCGVRRFRPPP